MAKSLQLAPQGQWIVPTLSEIYEGTVKSEPEKSGEDIVEEVMLNAGLSFGE